MEPPAEQTYRLPKGTFFYRIVDIDHPEVNADRYFLDPNRALMFELLTNPALLPLPGHEIDLGVFSETVSTKLGLQYRFPNAQRFRLVGYQTNQEGSYFNRDLTAEEIQKAKATGEYLVGYHLEQGLNRFMKGNYNFVEEIRYPNGEVMPNINWEKVFRALTAYSRVGETTDIKLRAFRLINAPPGFLVPFATFPIGWDAVWRLFITLHIENPDLKSIDAFFKQLLSDPQGQLTIIKGRISPGYDDCHEGVFGFVNGGTSCFMDSTLISMFAFKNSPFADNLLLRGLPPRGNFNVCNRNPQEDERLRQTVYDNLLRDYESIMAGNRIVCSMLRTTLGRDCNYSGDPESDFSFQMAAPDELYQRLLAVLNYNPLEWTESIWRAASETGEDEILSSVQRQNGTMLPGLRVEDLRIPKVSWPGSWNTEYENKHSGDRLTFARSEFDILKADVVVVHVDRAVYNPQEIPAAAPLFPQVPGDASNALSALFGLPAELPGAPSVGLPGVVLPSIGLMPSVPFRNPYAVNARRLEVDTVFLIGGQPYDLRAAVFSPRDGHYAALLKCGSDWFLYDDQEVSLPISEKRLDPFKARQYLETRAVLLFYYPPFKQWTQVERETVAELTDQLANVRIRR